MGLSGILIRQVICLGSLVAASAAAEIRGVVRSRIGQKPVANASVVLVSAERGAIRETRTGADGAFRFDAAPQPDWELRVSAEGFASRTVPALPAAPAVDLEVAAVEQLVVVTADTPAVTQQPEVAQTLDSRRLTELPSNARNLNRFALLNPHVRTTAGQGADGASGSRLTINMSSFRTTYYLLDGGANYDFLFGNAPQQKVSVSAVEEFKVLTNQYSAEYGRTTSGLILSTTRQGTDQLHGEALFSGRPSGIQAAPPVSTLRVPNELKQFGGSLGGPLWRGQAHVFANYEQLRQNRGSYIQSPQPLIYLGHLLDRLALVRVDHRTSANHGMTLRLNGNQDANDNANDRISGFTQPSAAQIARTQAVGIQFGDSRIFSPSLVSDFRVNYVNSIPSDTYPVQPSVGVTRPSYSTEGGSAYSRVRNQTAQASETLAARAGRHTLKIGGDYARQRTSESGFSLMGDYRFAPGAPAAGETPLQYSQTFGTSLTRMGQTLASLFVQDEWRVRSRLTVNLGARYEYQSATGGNNLAPRMGIAFDPRGDGKTVLRIGSGIFYDQYYLYVLRRAFTMGIYSPTATYTLVPGTAAFPQFPASLAVPPAGVAAQNARRDLVLVDENRRNPYSIQHTVGIQRDLGGGWILAVDGIYSNTVGQLRTRDRNAPAPFTRTGPSQLRSTAAADATRPIASLAGVPVRGIYTFDHSSTSLFSSLEAGVSHRFARGFQLESHYLYASAMTRSMFFGEPNTGIPQDWGAPDSLERGPSDYHQRHRWVTHGFLELPRQFQVSAASTVASGLPVNPLTGVDNNGDSNLVDRPWPFGRNSFRAPAQATLDLSVARRVALNERLTVEVRAEAFNLFNHSNFVRVNATYGDGRAPRPDFLAPIAGLAYSDPARQMQFVLRLRF